jgi:hypothetical protein
VSASPCIKVVVRHPEEEEIVREVTKEKEGADVLTSADVSTDGRSQSVAEYEAGGGGGGGDELLVDVRLVSTTPRPSGDKPTPRNIVDDKEGIGGSRSSRHVCPCTSFIPLPDVHTRPRHSDHSRHTHHANIIHTSK